MEIHDQILRKIANTLFSNMQKMPYLGLFSGRLGPALFFFYYGRYSNKYIYSIIANDCIDAIYGKIHNMTKEFADGLTGFGWTINHIVENHFVETDDDNTLDEVDEIVKNMDISNFMYEMSSETPLCSKGLYAIARNDKDFITSTLMQCKELLEQKDIRFSLCYLNSVLHIVIRAYKADIELALCRYLIEAIYGHVASTLEKKHYSESDLVTLQHFIRHIGQDISEPAKWKLLLEDIKISQKAILSSCWNYLIYGESGLKQVNISDINMFVDDLICNLRYQDLALYSGLSGLGIELIKLNENRIP